MTHKCCQNYQAGYKQLIDQRKQPMIFGTWGHTLRGRVVLTFALLASTISLPSYADGPLKGRIEDTQKANGKLSGGALQDEMEAKLDQLELQGGTQSSNLNGGLQNQNSNPLQGATSSNGPMNLSASNDPDSTDQSLQIGWDRWRNTLTQAIQAGTNNKINVQNEANFVMDQRKQIMVSRFPQGISTWYSCDVLPNRQIVNIKLTQSSGFQAFDQAVFQSIIDLQGSSILPYPNGSKRQIVNQQGSVQTASVTKFQNFQFGDIERQRH